MTSEDESNESGATQVPFIGEGASAVKAEPDEVKSAAERRRSVWAWLWSPDLTLWLIGILVVAMAVGTVIPQRESADAYRGLFGQVGGALLTRTSLTNVYGSWWFIAVFGLLAVNLAACLIQRASTLVRAERAAPRALSAAQVRGQRVSAELPSKLALDRTVERLSQALRRRGYRVESAEAAEKGATALRARRGAIRAWGAVVVHIGMVVVLLGAGYGHLPWLAFEDTPILGPGDSYRPGFAGAAFDVRLLDAGAEAGPEGKPSQFWANAQVVREGRVLRTVRITPNHPLRYGGANIVLQSLLGSGYAVEVRSGDSAGLAPVIMDQAGNVVMMETVRRMTNPSWVVFIHDFNPSYCPHMESGSAAANDTCVHRPAAKVFIDESGTLSHNWGRVGWVDATGMDYKGVHFRLVTGSRGAQFGVFRDLGVPVVWAGFAIVVLGCLLALLVTRRDVLAMVTPRAGGSTVLLGASARGFGTGGESVIDSLGREVTAREEGKR